MVTTTQQVSTEIERLFGPDSWEEEADFDITRLDYNRRVQVRETKHYNPKELVERYMVQMSESVFPPIVLTKDDWIVDGNTRVEARTRRKDKFASALVVDVAWEGASDKERSQLLALAATLNANAGAPLTSKEARAVTRELISLGWKTEEIGRAIGLKSSAVSQVKKEIAAEEKLSKVGLDPQSNGMKGASLRALGATNVVALNDVPYRELAQLSGDAGFNATEITQAAKAARETGADDAALAMLADLRKENENRIREHSLTGAGKPPVARQLRQHLGFVTKFEGREADLLETNADVREAHIASLTKAVAVLSAVIDLQSAPA